MNTTAPVVEAAMYAALMVKAKRLYETSENQVKPAWDQLGEGTKQAWGNEVMKGREPPVVSLDTLDAALGPYDPNFGDEP